MHEAHEGCDGFFASEGDSSEVFEFIEDALDLMALFVEPPVDCRTSRRHVHGHRQKKGPGARTKTLNQGRVGADALADFAAPVRACGADENVDGVMRHQA